MVEKIIIKCLAAKLLEGAMDIDNKGFLFLNILIKIHQLLVAINV